MRRPPLHLPSSTNNNDDGNNSSSTNNQDAAAPPSNSTTTYHQQHRPQLGHLPSSSSSSTSSSSSRPPLFGNIPSFAVTTMPGTNAHLRQKQEGHGPPPRSGAGFSSQAFPQFTRDGTITNNNFDKAQDQQLVEEFGQSEEGTMNFLLGSSVKSSSSGSFHQSHRNTHRQNAAFEFYLNIPSEKNQEQDQQQQQQQTSSTSSSLDKFFVRVWGPKYLFSQQPSDQVNAEAVLAAIRQKILHHHHRLVVMLHGAGMSSMCFHLVACQMLGIDANEKFIEIDERDPVLMNPRQHKETNNNDNADDEFDANESSKRTVPSTVMVAHSNHNNNNMSTLPQPIFVSFDYRCHGKTKVASSNPPCDLDSLALDVTKIIQRMFEIGANVKKNEMNKQQQHHDSSSSSFSSEKLFWAPDQSVCLVGHSVGGSVASAVSAIPEWRQKLFGLVLLDIVEGTALESIRHMPDFLKRRPKMFSSETEAIQWFVKFGGMRDFDAAKISVPSLLKSVENNDDDEKVNQDSASTTSSPQKMNREENNNNSEEKTTRKYEWITNLAKTEPFWNTWFHGMDGRFLHAICPRMLCLSSRDTLDKDLTVAHMQGQFQLEIFRDCGHYLMEDQPQMVGPVLMRFISRIEQQNEKLKAVYMKKFGGTTHSTHDNNNNSVGLAPATTMNLGHHAVNPHANLGTSASTIIPTFYNKK